MARVPCGVVARASTAAGDATRTVVVTAGLFYSLRSSVLRSATLLPDTVESDFSRTASLVSSVPRFVGLSAGKSGGGFISLVGQTIGLPGLHPAYTRSYGPIGAKS